MAIGRVAGPMLLSTLDRQGIDLNFTTNSNSLVYLDFSNFKMGVNTASLTETLTVDGNVSGGNLVFSSNTISPQLTSQNLVLSSGQELRLTAGAAGNITTAANLSMTSTTNLSMTSGTGITMLAPNVSITTTAGPTSISNVNIAKGNINATDIGTTTPSTGRFTTVTSTNWANVANMRVTSLTGRRIPFTSSTTGFLEDDPDLIYFSANNTLFVGNIQTTGALSYDLFGANNFTLSTGVAGQVFFANSASPSYVVSSANLLFTSANNNLRTGSLGISAMPATRVLYTAANSQVIGSGAFTYDGTTFSSNNTTILGNLRIQVATITGRGTNQDITIAPLGTGTVAVSNKRITQLAPPSAGTDAVNKDYVDGIALNFVTTEIAQAGSNVIVRDDTFGTANVKIHVNGILQGLFDGTNARFNDLNINGSTITALSGELQLVPSAGERLYMGGNVAVTLPIGSNAQRPILADTGDLRYNTDLNSIEFYNGTTWVSTIPVIQSEVIYPDGTSSTYTLSYQASTLGVLVNINGTIQQPTSGYSIAGNQITFPEPPLATDIIEIRYLTQSQTFSAGPVLVNTPYANVTPVSTSVVVDSFYSVVYRMAKYSFVAKSASTSRYHSGDINLLHNGVTPTLQMSGNITINGGNLVTFTSSIDPFGIVNLFANTAVSDTKVKLLRTYFTDSD
jgi:hypothetical protein